MKRDSNGNNCQAGSLASDSDRLGAAQRQFRDAEHLALLDPTWRQVGQASDTDTPRQATGDQGLYGIGRHEGQRDQHMNGALAPLLSGGQRFGIEDLT